ncbi:MAG: hypothetical protein N0E44_18975 [Candidatus Thiodiazotropha lotti]|nr:hypothetical protein [Candidatus Thiodiazotropha lotti]MCW4221969.1 hypothetical protein [Candidatus Thiodiazotropha lotti]
MTHTIELGHGDKLVTDICDPAGEWAGITISDGKCIVGETIETGAECVSDLNPELVIVTSNPKSLDVIIEACERAKLSISPYRASSDSA